MIHQKKNPNFDREFQVNTGRVENDLRQITKTVCQNFISTVLTEGILCKFVVGKWWKK